MQEIVLTPATLVVLGGLAAWAVWAVRRMTRRGLCDCGDHCGDGGCAGGCGGCSSGACGCALAEKMARDAERVLDR